MHKLLGRFLVLRASVRVFPRGYSWGGACLGGLCVCLSVECR